MTTQTADGPVWLSTAQAARAAGVSARSIRRAAAEGRLPAENVDGRWLVREDAVADLAGRRRASGTSGRDQSDAGTSGELAAALSVLAERLADAERRAAEAEAALAEARRHLAALGAGEAEPVRPAEEELGHPGALSPEPERRPWWRRWWAAAAEA